MTARDLLQQRSTKQDGDTIWVNSPLIQAAIEGKLALLDGLDQVHSSTLAVVFRSVKQLILFYHYHVAGLCYFCNAKMLLFNFLCRLVHDRELQLHDGSRLLRPDRYDALKSKYGLTDDMLNQKYGIFRIHPKFYIIATSNISHKTGSGKGQGKWLTPEMLSLFAYHQLPQMSLQEEIDVIKSYVSGLHILLY